MTTVRQDKKYQMIKLVHSGRTLSEAKSMMKAVTVGFSSEYAKSDDLKDLASLEGGLYRIRMTRNDARQLQKIRFGPRKLSATRDETLSKWATGYRGKIPLDWKRDGNLIRRGPPNKSRKGSSVGKIGRTRVIGAKKVLKDFRSLISTLKGLQKKGKGDVRDLQKAYRKVRVAASAKG